MFLLQIFMCKQVKYFTLCTVKPLIISDPLQLAGVIIDANWLTQSTPNYISQLTDSWVSEQLNQC